MVGTANLGQMFFAQAERRADQPFLHWRDGEEWRSLTYGAAAAEVRAVMGSLARMQLAVGDRVAILSENRPEWFLADLAILGRGLVDVPLYATLSLIHI